MQTFGNKTVEREVGQRHERVATVQVRFMKVVGAQQLSRSLTTAVTSNLAGSFTQIPRGAGNAQRMWWWLRPVLGVYDTVWATLRPDKGLKLRQICAASEGHITINNACVQHLHEQG